MNYSPYKKEFTISTDKRKINIRYVHNFLSNSYWAEGIPIQVVRRAIKNSLCFALYHGRDQVGFARMVTDRATFAYLADVFIDEKFRGHGLSKWLLETIMAHPDLQGLRRIMLATRDAHTLYNKFGFTQLPGVERWMQIHNQDVYKIK